MRDEPTGALAANGEAAESRRGILLGAAAYGMWGVFPIYFHLLSPAGALEILGQRIIWSMVFCMLAWVFIRDLTWVKVLLRHPRRLALLTLAAFVLSANWGVYIYAVVADNVVEASLGYFINPLVLVVMGVVLLHEKLRPMQWFAVGLGTIAVIVMAIDYGRPPWIALILAFSFAIYGFIKKLVGGHIGALESMTTETAVLAPFALVLVFWLEWTGRGTFGQDAPWHGLMLVGTGIITPLPLICFAAAARRVPLTTMGLLQFTSPVLQLVIGVAVFGEHVPVVRWIGFGIVWLALTLLTIDSIRHVRTRARIRQIALAEAGATS
ncbi:MAG: EamA family transporter RarD [Thermomicrobiales bacterium]